MFSVLFACMYLEAYMQLCMFLVKSAYVSNFGFLLYLQVCMYFQVSMHVCRNMCIYIYMCVCVFKRICVYQCMYIDVSVCIV